MHLMKHVLIKTYLLATNRTSVRLDKSYVTPPHPLPHHSLHTHPVFHAKIQRSPPTAPPSFASFPSPPPQNLAHRPAHSAANLRLPRTPTTARASLHSPRPARPRTASSSRAACARPPSTATRCLLPLALRRRPAPPSTRPRSTDSCRRHAPGLLLARPAPPVLASCRWSAPPAAGPRATFSRRDPAVVW